MVSVGWEKRFERKGLREKAWEKRLEKKGMREKDREERPGGKNTDGCDV